MSISLTTVGRFREAYRALERAADRDGTPLIDRTPVVLSEGDSWFATPLYPNLMDGVARRVQGLMLRVEKSGDTAQAMFSRAGSARLVDHLRTFRFDALLLSAGGNDFVDEFLAKTFKGAPRQTPTAALARVIDTGLFDRVHRAYASLVERARQASPATVLIAHTYAYPRRLGVPATLTVAQLGLAALFKRRVGDWITRHIEAALPTPDAQVAFVRLLVDAFHARVLRPLASESFRIVDLRDEIQRDRDWHDEMHPTAAAFDALAMGIAATLRAALPPAKRPAVVARPGLVDD